MTTEDVASTFVEHPQFSAVSKPTNAVILGCRGSGKTTLLRMLEPKARLLRARPNGVKVSLKEIGVFVPVDQAWLASIRSVTGSQPRALLQSLEVAVYSLSVARAMIDSLLEVLSSAGQLLDPLVVTEDTEVRVCEVVSHALKLGRVAKSLASLRFEIVVKIAELPSISHSAPTQDLIQLLSHLDSPGSVASQMALLLNELSGRRELKWMILCDELELANDAIRDSLIKTMRGSPGNLVFKLAMTPLPGYAGMASSEQPLPGHDFDVISLFNPRRNEGANRKALKEFCSEMWEELCRSQLRTGDPVQFQHLAAFPEVAGPLDVDSSEDASFAAVDSKAFMSLAARDASFAAYLSRKGVDPRHVDEYSGSIRDSVIRKIRPIVQCRLYYMRSGTSLKGRRSHAFYSGESRLFSLSEGHPRWIKSTLGAMLARSSGDEAVGLDVQSEEVDKSMARIIARLNALPVKPAHSLPAFNVISAVGHYFRKQVLGPVFEPEPKLSFHVDQGVPDEVVNAIESALVIGAVVPLPDKTAKSDEWSRSLVGSRFRLSFWLCPYFKLPVLNGKAESLSKILLDQGEPALEKADQMNFGF
ncbi:hypothetical protein C7S18_10115 [Ahniella affigens]|uniref:Uncharacterized protein n=2 Tax=Ahniella affigens TaxID=2021234 RepID=A0A2P1PRR9_9GAMM|nr:hypothetical protein C7S18_10115 [Ahniella affigens]